jgi:hypothetical protein
MEKFFTLPRCFFFGVIAPFNLEELDFWQYDTILLIQDFDGMLKVHQVSIKWCHFWQYDIHGCLQALLQLGYVKDIIKSYQ